MSDAVKQLEAEIKAKQDAKQDGKKEPKIDYLHPDGKPQISDEQKRINKEAQEKPVSQQALQEADGHHMCGDDCLGHNDAKSDD